MPKFHARVFKKDGNHFLIPGYWYPEDDENWEGMSHSSILCEGMMLSVVCSFDGKEEWMDFEANDAGVADLHYVPFNLCSSGFVNGGIKVLLFAGPLFEEAVAENTTVPVS